MDEWLNLESLDVRIFTCECQMFNLTRILACQNIKACFSKFTKFYIHGVDFYIGLKNSQNC